MSPVLGTFVAMTSLDVITDMYVRSLLGREGGDAQGFTSNKQDLEGNMVDSVPILKARSRGGAPRYHMSGQ